MALVRLIYKTTIMDRIDAKLDEAAARYQEVEAIVLNEDEHAEYTAWLVSIGYGPDNLRPPRALYFRGTAVLSQREARSW